MVSIVKRKKGNIDTWNKDMLYDLYWNKGMTTREIGALFRVTAERIRQKLHKFDIPCSRHRTNRRYYYRDNDLGNYLSKKDRVGRESSAILHRIMQPTKCESCGKQIIGRILIHHLRYPATAREDLKIQCTSCHVIEHQGKISLEQRKEIYIKYKCGHLVINLAKEYRVSKPTIYFILRKFTTHVRHFCSTCHYCWESTLAYYRAKKCPRCRSDSITRSTFRPLEYCN